MTELTPEKATLAKKMTKEVGAYGIGVLKSVCSSVFKISAGNPASAKFMTGFGTNFLPRMIEILPESRKASTSSSLRF